MQSTASAADSNYQRDLGEGLLLRWSTRADTANIAELVGRVFRNSENDAPNAYLQSSVELLMSGNHPLMGPGDYGVVEDTTKANHPIVACTCLWQHQWSYENVLFNVGRPEIVASDPTYRKRGLIRALFHMVHARSEARGDLVQAITGIPYFYRQFGYEYVLDLGGRRVTYLSAIPPLKQAEQEPYTLREASVEDVPLIMRYEDQRRASSMLWAHASEQYWRYEIRDGWQENPERYRKAVVLLIVDAQGEPVGFVIHDSQRRGTGLGVWGVEVDERINLQAIMPSVLRALQQRGIQVPTPKPDTLPLSEISFMLGRNHPVYTILGEELAPYQEPPYAWYIRVPDLPAFLKLIAPVLEDRVKKSPIAGYTGEVKLDFYNGGLRIIFEHGQFKAAENWQVPIYDANAGAGFPALVFLKALLGYRSLDELRYAYPDVWANTETAVVLQTLFPARPSFVTPF
ncbi:MAG TPA: GNAT family N-acetyltransferase [Ktedonobacteraceae bacterium]|nr:GNAT family N-acetyltransferase [Ktedonobacteraceae bacterium]